MRFTIDVWCNIKECPVGKKIIDLDCVKCLHAKVEPSEKMDEFLKEALIDEKSLQLLELLKSFQNDEIAGLIKLLKNYKKLLDKNGN